MDHQMVAEVALITSDATDWNLRAIQRQLHKCYLHAGMRLGGDNHVH